MYKSRLFSFLLCCTYTLSSSGAGLRHCFSCWPTFFLLLSPSISDACRAGVVGGAHHGLGVELAEGILLEPKHNCLLSFIVRNESELNTAFLFSLLLQFDLALLSRGIKRSSIEVSLLS